MQRFIVLVQRDPHARSFGVYRSFKKAEADAQAWGGIVLPLEQPDADNPWDAKA